MTKRKILIAGGSGLVGRHLASLLSASGHQVRILTRSESDHNSGFYHWDPAGRIIDSDAFEGVTTVINLAGAGIADRLWTPWRKRQIINSRLSSTRFLVELLNKADHQVECFISASAIGIYGDTGDKVVHEEDTTSSGFLADTCVRWEAEALRITSPEVRTVILRISNVLAKEGGVLPSLLLPFRFRLAMVFGSGKQYFSWIHIDDLCCMVSHAMNNKPVNGIYNATAPGPLQFSNLITLIKQIRRGWYLRLRLPAGLLTMAMGGMSTLLTNGTRVSPERILDTGFRFRYNEAGAAIRELIR
jgi:uncharacterized protein (TIGR01777 family)